MGILSFIVMAIMAHGQAQTKLPVSIPNNWTSSGLTCHLYDDRSLRCQNFEGDGWESSPMKPDAYVQPPMDENDPCTAGGCDGGTQEGPIGDLNAWNQNMGDNDTESGPGNCTKNSSSCTIGIPPMPSGTLAEDVPAIQEMLAVTPTAVASIGTNAVWTCPDKHHYTLLTSVDGQVHVCHRISQ